MKNITSTLAALLFYTVAAAQTPSTAPENALSRHLDPTVASVGKEPPRGDVVSHDTKADAVRQTYGASRYLQPLTEWTRSESAEAVTYSTHFKMPFGWIDREQFLYLGRVSGAFDVVVNGAQVAYSQTGSTPSEFDVTKSAREGMNDLSVVIYKNSVAGRLENDRSTSALRIEGEAHILSQPRERVRDVSISTRMEGTNGLLELGVILKSHRLNTHSYTVFWELLNPAGEIVAEGKKDARLDMRREDTVRFFANVPRIAPWSHEDPRLYTLYIKTQNEGRYREHLSFRIGFRSVALDPADGTLYLNGEPLKLAMREFKPTANPGEMRAALERMRGAGPTALMLNGTPPDRAFFPLCDSLGLYAIVRGDIDTHSAGTSRKVGGNPSNDPAWKAAYLDRTMAAYHTSKNHPSVVIFSLAGPSANGYNLYESYTALKAAERDRPVIYASAEGEWNTDAVDFSSAAIDLVGTAGAEDGTGSSVRSARAATVGDNFASTVGATASSSRASAPRTARSRGASRAATTPGLGLEAVEAATGKFRLTNRRAFSPFAGEALYVVKVGRKQVGAGLVRIEALPGEEVDFTVAITGTKPGKPYTVRVELFMERPDGDYLPDGDPNLRVYRRLDVVTPMPAAVGTVVATSETKVTFKKRR